MLSRKSSMPIHSRLFLTFSSNRFSVSGIEVLIYLKLSFVQGDKYGSICVLHAAVQFGQRHLLMMLSFFQCVSGFFIKRKIRYPQCVDLCLGLQLDFMDQQVHFHANTMLFLVTSLQFETRVVIPPSILLLFRIVLAILPVCVCVCVSI